MMRPNRKLHSHSTLVVRPLLILFAGLALFAGAALGQGFDPPEGSKPPSSITSGDFPPERKELQNGDYKIIYRNEKGEELREEEYTRTGVITRRTYILYIHPNRGDAVVSIESYGVTGKGSGTKTDTIYYNAKGDVIRTVTEEADGDPDSPMIRTISERGKTRIEKYDPQKGRWEEIPAMPPTTTPTAASGGSDTIPISYSRVEILGGYSYMREDSEPEGFNLNGWNSSIAYNFNEHVAARADFSGYYKSEDDPVSSTSLHKHQFLFGPQFSIRPNERVRVFLRPLFGVAHVSFSKDSPLFPSPLTSSDTAFAMALGGGLDINVNQRVFVRVVQLDYLPTHFGNSWQHNFRASTGIGFKFGGASHQVPDDASPGPGPVIAAPPQVEAEMCTWVRYNLGKDSIVTDVRSDKPKLVEVRLTDVAASGGFDYHCTAARGTALITYKYTDVNKVNQVGRLRVFCK